MEKIPVEAAIPEEIRKVQLTGRSSFIVSLPKKWVTKMGVKAGDQVIVRRQLDGSLILRTRSQGEEKQKNAKFTIANDELAETVARRIVSAYLAGFATIEVIGKGGELLPAQRDAIKDIVRSKLVGTEVVDESSNHMTLQVLVRVPEFDIKSALRRMVLITSSMHRDALKALATLNREAASQVIKADDDVDRFSFYIIRQLREALDNERALTEMGLATPSQCLGYRVITKSVERVADHALRIAEIVLAMKTPPPKRLLEEISKMSELSLSVFEAAIDSLFREDYQRADQVVLRTKKVVALEPRIIGLVSSSGESEAASLRLILEDVRRTAEYASDIAEIVLNRTIERNVSPS